MKRIIYLLIVTSLVLGCSKKVLKKIENLDEKVYEVMTQPVAFPDKEVDFSQALQQTEPPEIATLVVYFDLNSDELKPNSLRNLEIWMEGIPRNAIIHAEGHACPLGTEKYNTGLSSRRAMSVFQQIYGAIDTESSTVIGLGESQPTTLVRGEYALNRRVVITLK